SIIATDPDDSAFGQVIVASIPVGMTPEGLGFDPGGAYAYVANQDDGTVSIIDTSVPAVVDTVRVDGFPYGIAVHPDGSRVYVTISDVDAQVAVINASDRHVDKVSLTGARILLGIQISSDGNLAYAANTVPPF